MTRLSVTDKRTTSLTLDCSESLNAAEHLGAGWTIEEQDEDSLALTSVDFSTASFVSSFQGAETQISGEEKLKRLELTDNILAAGNILLALWKDYEARGKNSVIEYFRLARSIEHLDFPGLIVRDRRGNLGALYLYWERYEWHCRGYDLTSNWYGSIRSLVLTCQS